MTEQDRVNQGWQCPECYGVRIADTPRLPHDSHKFQCQECGCQWTGYFKRPVQP